MKKDIEEFILVFSTSLLKEIGYFQGLSLEFSKYIDNILNKNNYHFAKRENIEEDFNYKQLIPYVILKYKENIFSYRRGKLLHEERLLGNYSIGIGGHISINDPNLFTPTYKEGLKREIREELSIDTKYDERIAAVINDDSNEVGKVHFGIVHVFTLERPLVKRKEKSITATQFVSIQELKQNIHKYENWSKICIDNIEKLLT